METAPSYKPGNRRQKARRNAPKAEERRVAIHNDLYAYTFADPEVGSVQVLNSDRGGWWSGEEGRTILKKLIEAWKIDCNDKEACIYAGISLDQLEYFQKLHPDFYGMKELAKERMGFVAKKRFAKAVEQNGSDALTYLQMKRKGEGYTIRTDSLVGVVPLQPVDNEIRFVDFSKPAQEAPVPVEARDITPPEESHADGQR